MPKVLTKDNRIKEISEYIANDKQSMAHLGFTLIPEEPCSKKCEKDCTEEKKCETLEFDKTDWIGIDESEMEVHTVTIESEISQVEPIVEKITAAKPVKRGKSTNKINGNQARTNH